MPTIFSPQLGAIAFANSIILKLGILGTNISLPNELSIAQQTIFTPSSREILNLVIFSLVIGNVPE